MEKQQLIAYLKDRANEVASLILEGNALKAMWVLGNLNYELESMQEPILESSDEL